MGGVGTERGLLVEWRKRGTVTCMPSPHTPDESISLPMVLGSLRSELDTPDEVPPNFDRLRRAFYAALDSYLRGERTKAEVAPLLDGLKATDATGQQWTLGATTGTWFRRVGSRWMMSGPPVALSGDAQDGPWRTIAAQLLGSRPDVAPRAEPVPTVEPSSPAGAVASFPDDSQAPPQPTSAPAPESEESPVPPTSDGPSTGPDTDDDPFAAFLPSPNAATPPPSPPAPDDPAFDDDPAFNDDPYGAGSAG